MDPFFVAAVLASTGVAVYFGLRGRRQPEPEAPAPLAEGAGTICGRAEGEKEFVTAPLTKTKCLAYEVEVFARGGESSWSITECARFSIIVVDTQVAVRAAPGTLRVASKQREVVSEPRLVWDLLEQVNADPSQFEGAWAVESRLQEGERAYLTGDLGIEVYTRSTRAGAYRARPDQHWVMAPPGDGKLSIDWQPRDESSPDEEPERGAGWRQRVAPVVAWMRRHGVTCPSCDLTSSRMRYVDDLISDPFLVCRRCSRSFDPPV